MLNDENEYENAHDVVAMHIVYLVKEEAFLEMVEQLAQLQVLHVVNEQVSTHHMSKKVVAMTVAVNKERATRWYLCLLICIMSMHIHIT